MHLLHKMKKVHLLLILSLGTGLYLGLGAFVPSAFSQAETGQITVRVSDPQGARVAGASVTAKNTATGVETAATTTNSDGVAIIAALQNGIYDVTVNATGFAPTVQRVQVTVGARVTADIALSVQAQPEVVTVIGSQGVEVNVTTQQLSDVVAQTQLAQLPTLTRNPYDFVGLSGNVFPQDPNTFVTIRGTGFSINGQRAASTNILLDGGENNSTFDATVGQTVPLDAVQEFRVITSNFDPQYGRATGGIVNVATKSGSNQIHGTAYEFNRISALASNNFFNNANGIAKGVFTRNQFGYSVGGPVIKDKLFFFSSTEWIRVRSNQDQIALVPTPQFLAVSAPNTQNFFNAFPLKNGINGTTITAGQVLATPTGAFAGLPANFPVFGQSIFNVPADIGAGLPQNTVETVGRVDYNMNANTSMYWRYAFTNGEFPLGTNAFSPFVGFDTGIDTRDQNILYNVTHNFSPLWVASFKGVFNRLNQNQPLGAQPVVPTLYMRQIPTTIQGFPVAFPGYLPFNPGLAIPFGGPQNLLQLYGDASWSHGVHQIKFGGTFIHIQDNRTFGAYETAVETLGTSVNQSLNNFLTGQLQQFQVAVNPQGQFPGGTITLPATSPQFSRSNRYNEASLYVGDNWKVMPRLTLDLGLRWDYFGVQHNTNQQLDSNFYFGPGSNFFSRTQNGQVIIAPNSPADGLWGARWGNFGPRLGFAWDVFGNGSASLRGGWGIAFERNFGNVTFNVIQNPPAYAVASVVSGVDVGAIPITLNNFGPLGGTGTAVLPRSSLRAVDPDIETSHAQFWSLAFQKQLWWQSVFSVAWSGSRGFNLYDIANINLPGSESFLGGATGTARVNSQYSNINWRSARGNSFYNALILSYNTPLIKKYGLQLTTAYTFSRQQDNLSTTFSEAFNNFNLGYLDPWDPRLDWGPSDTDIRNRVVVGLIWDVPHHDFSSMNCCGANTKSWGQRALSFLANGWTFTSVFAAHSGTPFTIFDCSNGITTCVRMVQTAPIATKVASNAPQDQTTPDLFHLIDTSNQTPGVFVNPLTGISDVGPFPANTTGRNRFRGPGFWNLDAGIYKAFRITEGTSLQLRLEGYNVFNHANMFVIGNQADISSFTFLPGQKLGTRNVQLAAKIIF
jgi:hypothetical protein